MTRPDEKRLPPEALQSSKRKPFFTGQPTTAVKHCALAEVIAIAQANGAGSINLHCELVWSATLIQYNVTTPQDLRRSL